jgi:hypothetical protein
MEMVAALLVNALVVWFVIRGARSLLLERRKRAERTRNQEELVVSPRSGLAMGAMFLGLQAIVDPEARHAIVEILEEQSLEDGSGGEPLGGRAFHEALRRIRRGEEVEGLAVQATGPRAFSGPKTRAGQEETRSS